MSAGWVTTLSVEGDITAADMADILVGIKDNLEGGDGDYVIIDATSNHCITNKALDLCALTPFTIHVKGAYSGMQERAISDMCNAFIFNHTIVMVVDKGDVVVEKEALDHTNFWIDWAGGRDTPTDLMNSVGKEQMLYQAVDKDGHFMDALSLIGDQAREVRARYEQGLTG